MFCGIGGDLIRYPKSLFAVCCDLVESRLHVAAKMHERLGACRVDFVLTDSVAQKSCFRHKCADAVYLSPPWGHFGIRNRHIAPVYGYRKLSSLEIDGFKVFSKALDLAKMNNIAYFLPRGMDMEHLEQLAIMAQSLNRWIIEIHESFDPDDQTANEIDRYRVRAITLYFGRIAANIK